tara:strand:+ start:445 stop:780 length:336 start_codon:yes stop_codon:yes gene_type:complete
MKPTVVSVNPALFTSPSGQRYAVAGSVWVPVPFDTTRENMGRYVSWELPESSPAPTTSSREWSVKGSKGNIYCVVERDGSWGCSCVGYGYRRKCRHIDETKKRVAAAEEGK